MRRHLIVAVAALLTACGGSADDDLWRSDGLKVQAEAYVNAMPSVIFPDQAQSCSNFIISYSVVGQTSAIPKPASVKSVSASKKGQVLWTGPVSVAESGQGQDGSLYGVARGCPPTGLAENDLLDIVLHIEAASQSGDATAQAVLYFAY